MKWMRGQSPEAYDHYLLISLPSSFVGIMDYESFGWLNVLPVDASHTRIRSGYLKKGSSSKDSKEGKAFTDVFFAEDKWICERVQQGMKSCHGQSGKLVKMERVVVDFHQFLAFRLFGTLPDELYESEQEELFTSGQSPD